MTSLALRIRDDEEVGSALRLGARYVTREDMGDVLLLDSGGPEAALSLTAVRRPGNPFGSGRGSGEAAGDGMVVAPGGERLFSVFSYPQLAAIAADARRAGLAFAIGGTLEETDIPRLMPLAPDVLIFDDAARDRDGALDAGRCEALLRAMAAPDPSPDFGGGRDSSDIVFVRGYEAQLLVGAYRYEEAAPQRVRFDVEVAVAPPSASGEGIAAIFSYDRILDAIDALAAGPHVAFVETLAEALAAELLLDPRARSVTVRVEKPDLGRAVAGVEIRRGR